MSMDIWGEEEAFDFTGTTRDGTIIKPGQYNAEIVAWNARPKGGVDENGKPEKIVHDIDFAITDEDYLGEEVRAWHTVVRGGRGQKEMFMALLQDLDLVKEKDRGSNGELKVRFDWSQPDENGHRELIAIDVNDTERSPIGAKAILKMSNRENTVKSSPNYGQMMNWVDQILPADKVDVDPDDDDLDLGDNEEDIPF